MMKDISNVLMNAELVSSSCYNLLLQLRLTAIYATETKCLFSSLVKCETKLCNPWVAIVFAKRSKKRKFVARHVTAYIVCVTIPYVRAAALAVITGIVISSVLSFCL